MAHSKEFQAKLLAIVSLEAEHQYLGSNDYRAAWPWSSLDDLNQQAWSWKACDALGVSPQQWRAAINACRTPGQSVKLLLSEMRVLYPKKSP